MVAVAGLAGGWFMTNRPLAVETVVPEENVQLRLYGLGSVEARIVARIGFEASAAVTELAADAGDKIRKGQAIAKLRSVEQEAKVVRSEASAKAAQSALEKARAAIERYKAILGQKEAANRRQQQLARTDSTSAQKAEEAQRNVDAAKADLAVANADLSAINAQTGEAQSAWTSKTHYLPTIRYMRRLMPPL
jgi:HlyD family secretion protein